ncbi:MAG: ISAs1 family transposase, partial [Acidobacteria bacterium]|nr:ISAs1 family transposase [Acidobacteriota bacterium]
QNLLREVHVELAVPAEIPRLQSLLRRHHYLGGIRPVGQRLYYIARDASDGWLAVLVFSAPAKHLKDRDRWIGWSEEQRRRRLSLITNNSRFLLLPERSVPNLGSRVLRLTLERLPQDWQNQYGHPVEIVETFVDPAQFCGTVYTASGWMELGQTDGWGRVRRDYYVKHDQPKRLFVRALRRQSCRSLQAEHLKADLAVVEARVAPRCTRRAREIGSIVEHFKKLPEYRQRVESYPLFSLGALVLLAMLCEAPRGQTDLAKFAGTLSRGQRRVLGIRRNPQGKYPAPSQSTFSRFFAGINPARLQEHLLEIQRLVRGPAPPNELVVIDGKEPRHGSGTSVLSAITVPSQHLLGSAVVDQKTNEIPVAQKQLIPTLDLAGRLVSLDALHTQDETARAVVLEGGGDYLLTVKNNQAALRASLEKKVTAPRADFPPGESHFEPGAHLRAEQRPD